MTIEVGLCQCGCGQRTRVPTETNRSIGAIKGVPLRYLHGHHLRGRTPGSYLSTAGYRLVWKPDHPDAYKQKGYVLEHRLVMERVLGRRLTPAEGVHHINHDKLDNRAENLELVDRVSHGAKHGRPRGMLYTAEQRAAHSIRMKAWWAARKSA